MWGAVAHSNTRPGVTCRLCMRPSQVHDVLASPCTSHCVQKQAAGSIRKHVPLYVVRLGVLDSPLASRPSLRPRVHICALSQFQRSIREAGVSSSWGRLSLQQDATTAVVQALERGMWKRAGRRGESAVQTNTRAWSAYKHAPEDDGQAGVVVEDMDDEAVARVEALGAPTHGGGHRGGGGRGVGEGERGTIRNAATGAAVGWVGKHHP